MQGNANTLRRTEKNHTNSYMNAVILIYHFKEELCSYIRGHKTNSQSRVAAQSYFMSSNMRQLWNILFLGQDRHS